MLTPEQIKNLKPGDPLLIHGTFVKTHYDGDIQYESPYTGPDDKISNTYRSTIPSCVSLPEHKTVEITLTPTPKYDPCRLFKKGDIVEPVERWGRKLRIKAGHYRIDTDEVDNRVMMTHCETGVSFAAIDTVYLNLITPVEEVEPYKIAFDDVTQNWNVIKDGVVLCSYKGTKHPHAEKSAEAERDRLNEEYRKENQQ